MKSPFIIYGLPRSRTYWISQFLSYRAWNCSHDQIRYARSLEDVRAWFSQGYTGTVETLAAPWWRIVPEHVRSVVVRRDPEEVVESVMRLGNFDRVALAAGMRRLDRKLDQIEKRVPGVISMQFADLKDEATCARLFEHCLPYGHDHDWWVLLSEQNLQSSMAATIRYMEAYLPQLEKLARTAKYHAVSRLRTVDRPIDGLLIQQESFDDFYRDSKHLFRDHMLVTGQDIEDYTRKNLPLMRSAYERGNLQVTTARSNGRVFGYLMAIMGESFDAVGAFEGLHMTFYASSEFPGLGMKLQRSSIDALRAKGVDDLYFRAGTRGSGPRLGTMYRRLGAEVAGQIYHLRLKDAA